MNIIFDKETIGKYTLGKVVLFKGQEEQYGPGHIVGFGRNCKDQVTICVKFCGLENNWYVYPTNLEVL